METALSVFDYSEYFFIVIPVLGIYVLWKYQRTGRFPLVDKLPEQARLFLLRVVAVGLFMVLCASIYGLSYDYIHTIVQYLIAGNAGGLGIDDSGNLVPLAILGIFFWGSLDLLIFSFRESAFSKRIEDIVNSVKRILKYMIGILFAVGIIGYAIYLAYRAVLVVPLHDVAIATSVGTLLVLLAYAGVRIVHEHKDERLGASMHMLDLGMAFGFALLVFFSVSTLILIFANMFGGDRASVYGTMITLVVYVYVAYAYKYTETHTPIVRVAHEWAEKHPMRILLGIPGAIAAIILVLSLVVSISVYLFLVVFFTMCVCVVGGIGYAAWKQMLVDYKEDSMPDVATTMASRLLDALKEDYYIEPFVYETSCDERSVTILMNVYSIHDRDRLEQWLADELCAKLDLERIEITDCEDTSYEIEPIHTLCYIHLYYRQKKT